MDGFQIPQGYRATTWWQFTFYHEDPRNSWYSFDRSRKDERPSRLQKINFITHCFLKILQRNSKLVIFVNLDMPGHTHLKLQY